jgi:hypothetical protein
MIINFSKIVEALQKLLKDLILMMVFQKGHYPLCLWHENLSMYVNIFKPPKNVFFDTECSGDLASWVKVEG